MSYAGEFDASDVVYLKFTTVNTSGVPTQLAGTPAISIYKDGSTTQSTTGVTLTVDFDSVTGLNHVAIDTSADGTFYAAGSDFIAVITTGTVSGSSVVGYEVGSFSIRNRAGLLPTTAGRTLDVASTGEAGLDFNNILSTSLVTLHSLTVTGATTLSGAVSLGSTLDVTGTTTLAAVTTSGTVTMNAFTVTNATTLSGAVSLGSTLGVTGTTTFAAINAGAVGVTTLATSGTTTLNALTVTNATTLSGAVSLGSTLGITGTTTLAALTTSGTVTFNSFVANFSAATKTELQTEAEDALVVHRLDELLNADSDIDGAAPPTVGSVFHELLTKTTGSFTYDQTTDSLEALRDNMATTTGVADAVWDEARSGHLAAGSFGQAMQLVRSGTAQSGGTATLTLDASASSSNDFYNGTCVQIIDGTGAGQTNLIEDYVGTTNVATVRNDWVTAPDATSVFVIHPLSLDLTLLDVAVSTRMPSAGSLSTISAISGDDLELLIGVDYKDANDNAVPFAPDPSDWPDLTDAVVTLVLQNPTSTANIEVNGAVDVATGTSQSLHFDVPSTTTSALPAAYGRYWVKATLASGDIYPLASGVLRWRDPLEA